MALGSTAKANVERFIINGVNYASTITAGDDFVGVVVPSLNKIVDMNVSFKNNSQIGIFSTNCNLVVSNSNCSNITATNVFKSLNFPVTLFRDTFSLYHLSKKGNILTMKLSLKRFWFDHNLRLKLPPGFRFVQNCI